MPARKVSISALQRRAPQVAEICGISRDEAVGALIAAHLKIDTDVDFGSGFRLDFTAGADDEMIQAPLNIGQS